MDKVEPLEFTCHKVVRAFEVTGMSDKYAITGRDLLGRRGESYYASTEWLLRHRPETGGYVVIYDDGYTSYSPKAAFEDGYTATSETH